MAWRGGKKQFTPLLSASSRASARPSPDPGWSFPLVPRFPFERSTVVHLLGLVGLRPRSRCCARTRRGRANILLGCTETRSPADWRRFRKRLHHLAFGSFASMRASGMVTARLDFGVLRLRRPVQSEVSRSCLMVSSGTSVNDSGSKRGVGPSERCGRFSRPIWSRDAM